MEFEDQWYVRIPEPLPATEKVAVRPRSLTNLLSNAAVHTPPGTEVELSVKADVGALILVVTDRGPGIPPQSLPHLFEKFYRAPTARTGGTGLGLSLVKGFVEAHGGHVEARNRPTGGAAFTIRLPLGDELPSSL
jgi:two-component system sensor histidine kinase KdpD